MLNREIYAEDTLTIQEMLQKAGNSDTYQLRIFSVYFLVFLFASFIQMGFPIIFQPAVIQCPPQLTNCSQKQLCELKEHTLSDTVQSVAYTFDLTCQRSKLLTNCFNAFLYGGFIGSLYYGQIIERRGRRYAVLQSMAIMVVGLVISLLAGNVTLFSLGIFLFNGGFRGFFNASLLTLTEVMNEVSRSSAPMVLSIGWALGQILVAILGIWITSWHIIFLLTAFPLAILFYYAYIWTYQSPRFLVVKHKFQQSKQIIKKISIINGNIFYGYQLKQQKQYQSKIQGYRQIMIGGQVISTLKHHSYTSMFKFNSIRIRIFIVGIIWSIFSLSYFISANSQINPDRGYAFNIAFAGIVQIIAYFGSLVASLNFGRVYIIRRLIIYSVIVHLSFFFVGPLNSYTGMGKVLVMTLTISVRVLMSIGNTFLAIYTLQLFPTSIRHFTLGMLGFITKLMYMLSFVFDHFWTQRHIHPNFIIGMLFLASYVLTSKLRETKDHPFKDNLSEDGDGTLMEVTTADVF